jgi:hypothetical protein
MIRLVALFSFVAAAAAADVNVAVIRFRPSEKTALLRPLEKTIGAKLTPAKLLGAFQKKGDASIVFQTQQKLGADQKCHVEQLENAKVVLPGQSDAMPPITRFGIKLDVKADPTAQKRTAVYWTGSVRWSPQLVDASGVGGIPLMRGGTNVALIRPFSPLGDRVSAFEYPTLKENHFDGSSILSEGEIVFSATAAESGGAAPEMVVLCLWMSSL